MFKLPFKSKFVRSVSVLAGGTAIAQALGLLALPFLTRIYSPEDFGVLGVFVALLGLIAVISSLRYEIAIPLPESDHTAANLLALALSCVFVTTGIVTVVVSFFSGQITDLVNTPSLVGLLWVLPIAVAITGTYNVFQYWATRKKSFKKIARTRVEQSVGGVSTQLLMGYAGAGVFGLIVGQIVNNGAGVLRLGRHAFKEDGSSLKGVSFVRMKEVARSYDRFPKYSTFEALTNTAGIQVPMILVASLTMGAEVGFLMLAMRIMQAPMGLVGASISQVYLSQAVEEHRNSKLGNFTARTIGGLAKVGVGPIIFAGIVAPVLIGLIFGEQWERAGEIIAWMTPWFVLQFLVSPVSMAFHVTNNQRKALILQVAGLVLRVLMVLAASVVFTGKYVSEVFALSGFLFYILYLLVVCRIVNITSTHIMKIVREMIPFVVGWVLVAGIVRLICQFYL